MPSAPQLILVDGSSYLYRAFHALPPLTNSRGEPTGAVYGVLNMLQKFIKEQQGSRVVVVFDAPGKTFRDDLYDQYKAHRPPMPDDMRSQIEPLYAVVKALGLPLLRVAGVEADDVIGTLACRACADGERVWISTGDKDMAQLVNDKITLVNTMTNTALDRAGVKAKFDVWPEQIVDYLALVGDSSDNIPGIDKVGPKTAAKWLAKYGTIDALVANAAEVDGKVGENLRAGLTTLALSRQLATIRTDMSVASIIGEDAQALTPRPTDFEALKTLYARLEFKGLLRALGGETSPLDAAQTPTSSPPPTDIVGDAALEARLPEPPPGSDQLDEAMAAIARNYETLTDWAGFERWLQALREAPLFALDTATTSADYMTAEIVGLSFAIEPGAAAYIPLRHDYAGAPVQLDRDRVLAALQPLFEDARIGKLGRRLKYDAHVLANHGVALGGMRFDSMLESYVWNSVATRHDMETTAKRYLGIDAIKFEDVAGKGVKQLTFNQVPVDSAATYAAGNADITLRLHRTLWPRLEGVPTLQGLYEHYEQPLLEVLQKMERRGVLIDPALLQAQSSEIVLKMRELTLNAHREAGTEFNLESPKQLQQVLYEKLQLPVLRKTPTGQPSTAEDVLEELAASYPLPRLIIDYRGMAKLKSTYTDKLPDQIDERSGRIHTCYNQAVAATGRLSSTDPNLQNIPIRTAEGRRIRQAFIAPPGHLLMAADYSQIELRIMAHLSGDEGLLRAFADDRDVHQATASEVFSVPLEEVTADQRRSAKAINFGLIYGMSAFGLARQLGIDRSAAARYVELYFQRYPGVKRFMDTTRAQAKQLGYVETVFGRRLYLPEINSRNRQLQQYAERSAINAPMQGTAADIIKGAMIRVEALCGQHALDAKLVMQVHDELVLEVPAGAVARVEAMVREQMVAAGQLRVPLKVDVGVGANWDEAH